MEFIVPLVLAIGLITTLALLLLGLISASWQVLLAILILGLAVTGRLIKQCNNLEQQELSENESTQANLDNGGFVYRGVFYDRKGNPLRKEETKNKEELHGKYRGVDCTYIK